MARQRAAAAAAAALQQQQDDLMICFVLRQHLSALSNVGGFEVQRAACSFADVGRPSFLRWALERDEGTSADRANSNAVIVRN